MTAQPVLETAAGKAYRELRRRILQRELKPGDDLRQHRLAKQLGITTSPLREALVRLEADGLVETVPQWGTRVRIWNLDHLLPLLELRIAIECRTAHYCALRASDQELEELVTLGRQLDPVSSVDMKMSESQSALYSAVALDATLHRRIAEFARSPLLLEQLDRIDILQQLISANVLFEGVEYDSPPDSHVDLARAIATRDGEHAERAMKRHLASTYTWVVQCIEKMNASMKSDGRAGA